MEGNICSIRPRHHGPQMRFSIPNVSGFLFCVWLIVSCEQKPRYLGAQEMYSTSSLNIREGPGTNFKVLKTVKPNAVLIATDSAVNNFVMVLNSDSTKCGWVASRFLQLTPLSKSQMQAMAEEALTKEALSKKSPGPSSDATLNDHTLGYKLAMIEGSYRSESDLKVKRYNSLIKQLDDKYAENSERIADMTVKARRMMADDGVDESYGNILEGMNLIFSLKQDSMRYSDYAASYVIMRRKGRSHKEAIENLTAFLQALGIY